MFCALSSLSFDVRFSRPFETAVTDAHVKKLNDVIREHDDVIDKHNDVIDKDDDIIRTGEAPSSPAPQMAECVSAPDSTPSSPSPPPSPPPTKPNIDPSPLGAMAMREYDIILREVANQRASLLRGRESGSLPAAGRQSSHLDHSISHTRGSLSYDNKNMPVKHDPW